MAWADQTITSSLSRTPASLTSTDRGRIEELLAAKPDTLKLEGGSFFQPDTTGQSYEFLPVRYEPVENAAGAAVFFECAFVIRRRDGKDSVLKTVGAGLTEATSCGGIVSHGSIQIAPDQTRLGVIYDFQSPNVSFKSNILVEWNSETKNWAIDEKTLESDYGSSELDTIWKLREYFRQRN